MFLQKLYIYNTYGGYSVTSVNQTYEQHLNSKPCVCSTTFGRATLGANSVSNKLFLAFLFSNPDVRVQFLKYVALIRRVWCAVSADHKYPGASTLAVRTVTDDVGGSHLLPHALLPRQSDTVHGFIREFHDGFVPHVRRRSLIRTRSRARGGMWRYFSILTTEWGTTSSPLHICGCVPIRQRGPVYQVHRLRCNHRSSVATVDRSVTRPHHRGHVA
jgi:hypothetical protein